MSQSKPQMPQELLERLMGDNPVVDNGLSTRQSTQSFSDRRRIEQSRGMVRGYRESIIGSQNGRPSFSNSSDGSDDRSSENSVGDSGNIGRQRIETNQNRPSAGFQEPPSRRYNPYG